MRKLSSDQRQRLNRLFRWSRMVTGKKRGELARALGRDPARPVPDFDPPLKYVNSLADMLNLPLGVVASFLYADVEVPEDNPNSNGVSGFNDLEEAAKKAHRSGEYVKMIDTARMARDVSTTSDQRARAYNLEAGGYDGLGRFTEALEATQRGLHEPSLTPELRRMLLGNLAGAYYTLWRLYEARSLAFELMQWFKSNPPNNLKDRVAEAHAFYVHGNAERRLTRLEPDSARQHAIAAKEDLTRAEQLYLQLAKDRNVEVYAGIANTCRGGLIELSVAMSEQEPSHALQQLMDGIKTIDDDCPAGDGLESHGWWCIFGCNILLHHLADDADFGITMAILTEKAGEIATRLNNWSLRERVLSMNFARHEYVANHVGPTDWTIDGDDVREILGTIGRFPQFRKTGWRILQTAIDISSN